MFKFSNLKILEFYISKFYFGLIIILLFIISKGYKQTPTIKPLNAPNTIFVSFDCY